MSRITHLKIKIKTLSSESGIIRLEEQKSLAHGRKSKSLGREDFKPHYQAYDSMHDHRLGIVRSVARENLIAYGYLRGLTISQIESPNSDPFKFSPESFLRIANIAKNFSTGNQKEKQDLHTRIISDLTEWRKKLVAGWPQLQALKARQRAEKKVKRAAASQEKKPRASAQELKAWHDSTLEAIQSGKRHYEGS